MPTRPFRMVWESCACRSAGRTSTRTPHVLVLVVALTFTCLRSTYSEEEPQSVYDRVFVLVSQGALDAADQAVEQELLYKPRDFNLLAAYLSLVSVEIGDYEISGIG